MNRHTVALIVSLVIAPTALAAQGRETITITGGNVTFAAPTAADFNNGYLPASGALTYTVKSAAGGTGISHTSTVSVRSTAATLGGTKPISDLQWRRSDLSTWNSMTTTAAFVEQRTIVRRGTNDPWSNQIFFQMLLSFANDAPGAHSGTLVFVLTITTP